MVVEEGDNHGLLVGVYAQTNVTPESYQADFNLRNLIRTSITLDLMDESQKPPTIADDAPFHLDMRNAISFQQCAVAPNGAIVLRLSPALPSEVDTTMKSVEFGGRMKFIPKTPNP